MVDYYSKWPSIEFLLLFISILVSWLILELGAALARRTNIRLMHQNFRGGFIPVIGGLPYTLFGLFLAIILLCGLEHPADQSFDILPYAIVLLGFGLLGFIDDIFGDRSVGGFRGHFLKLIQSRNISTGLIKALGGGCLALVTAYEIARSGPASVLAISTVLFGLFIALSANAINLIDLRPGRSTSIGFVALFMLFILEHVDPFMVLVLICLLIPVLRRDRAGKIMLGDCGSNALGAAIGVAYVLALPLWGICIGVVILLAFNLWCEKHSVSKLIEDTPWLRALDRKIGVR